MAGARQLLRQDKRIPGRIDRIAVKAKRDFLSCRGGLALREFAHSANRFQLYASAAITQGSRQRKYPKQDRSDPQYQKHLQQREALFTAHRPVRHG